METTELHIERATIKLEAFQLEKVQEIDAAKVAVKFDGQNIEQLEQDLKILKALYF